MGTNVGDFSQLTIRHGCKCMPDASVSVEDCLVAVSAAVGGVNIRSASRMNKAIVIFLSQSQMANDLIENGLTINEMFVPVLPLSSPSKKIVLSNVPPFVKNEKLEEILVRYGKLVSPIKMITLGCKNPELKHVMSFRRQVFMILNSHSDPLNLSVKLTIEGKDYTIFISSESMKCFICGDFGHVRQTCPNRHVNNGTNGDLTVNVENDRARQGTSDVTVDAVSLQPPQARAESTPISLPELREGRSLLGDSSNSEVQIAETAADQNDVITQPELSSEQVNAKEAREAESPGNEEQISEVDLCNAKISTDESIDQSQGASVSQEVMDLSLHTEDFDKDDEEIYDENDVMDSENTSEGKTKLYSLQQINAFLDNTKGLRKISIESYFPDLKLFLSSCTIAMRKTNFDELDRPKRYRLKKILCNVRSILLLQGKK